MVNGDDDANDVVDDPGPDETTSTSTRWAYTNDWLAFLLVAFTIGSTSSYIYQGATVPIWLATVDGLAIVTAVVWAFGKGAFSAAADALSKE